ncbi:PD-(D/E)XK nuclease family protein [Thiomicrorhabdus sp. ZW0627]|uniref:PD-(D/E)XK nuclease family protein n=1 Tax=Thiomicrorhabdus sp. ZW0627 TaxID=3039774 RepID=UPI002436A3D1|nr:PD-(D/E)XK nuclease family protein [Thiomicrorhabdus sp. ZW0627]MDG6773992.1 PD-(D/E)XK nuclease family protein [Thiomicrorhabdus sp. ZW0627]
MSVIHLTANSRLTQTLKQQALASQTQTVIVTPQVMTIGQWWLQWEQACLLRGELAQDDLSGKILSTFEAQLVWEQVLEQEIEQRTDDQGQPLTLLNPSSTAKQLYQAWSLWMEWLDDSQRDEVLELHFHSEEVELFKSGVKRYQAILDEHGWQDEVQHQRKRLQWLADGKGRLPQSFVLHGFDEITPLMKRWRSIAEQRGCQVLVQADMEIETAPQVSLYTAQDPLDEVRQVANWCVQQWLELQKTKPVHSIKIGVVAPNLADYKAALSGALDEQLALAQQQWLHLQSAKTHTLYNLSLGVSLREVPLVKNALQTLKLFLQPRRTCAYSEWSEWLISPYTAENALQRQQSDASLRRMQWTSFKWPSLLAAEAGDKLPKGLKKRLQQWQKKIESESTASLSVAEFVDLAEACLQTLGWASFRELNSDEYQQKQAFGDVLARFRSLTATQGKQSLSEWLSVLNRYVGETLHQSQSRGLQPIQIMGMLEAGGQQFDALWVMGLTDEAWPRMPNPNPFLPVALQRTYKLPRCDAQRELEYARQVTKRLYAAAPVQVWSYAHYLGEAELLNSPLLESDLFEQACSFTRADYRTLASVNFDQRSDLVWELDNRGPEIPEGTHAPGGTGILQAQSKCPLMAFMDFRLGARNDLQEVEDGLQSTNQGTLIHEVLEHFWQETKTQANLFTLSDEEIQQRLIDLIQTSFDGLKNAFDEHYLALEQARILELLLQWMDVEKQRPSFAVEETERETLIKLAGIEFRVIIDRIDTVSGEKVILDYKTGKASINDLLVSPVKAPQLAVYLHTLEDSVAGIGYALLHSDDGVSLNALAAEDEVLSGGRSVKVFAKMAEKEGSDFYEVQWPDFLESLKQEVLDLAHSIQQGVADMRFDKPADIAYAASLLALRLPEVEMQLAQAGIRAEEIE